MSAHGRAPRQHGGTLQRHDPRHGHGSSGHERLRPADFNQTAARRAHPSSSAVRRPRPGSSWRLTGQPVAAPAPVERVVLAPGQRGRPAARLPARAGRGASPCSTTATAVRPPYRLPRPGLRARRFGPPPVTGTGGPAAQPAAGAGPSPQAVAVAGIALEGGAMGNLASARVERRDPDPGEPRPARAAPGRSNGVVGSSPLPLRHARC